MRVFLKLASGKCPLFNHQFHLGVMRPLKVNAVAESDQPQEGRELYLYHVYQLAIEDLAEITIEDMLHEHIFNRLGKMWFAMI